MDIGEAYAAGGFWGDSGAYAATFLLLPAFVNPKTGKTFKADNLAGPVVISDYGITQQPGGNGICLVLFDATAVPASGRAMFTGSPTDPQPKRIIPLPSGSIYEPGLCSPWHRFDQGFVAVMSTSYTTLTYAAASTFFSVRYHQTQIGGYAYHKV